MIKQVYNLNEKSFKNYNEPDNGFKEIYKFSLKKDCNEMNDCEIYHYPNIMRKILEGYLEFKVKKIILII